MAYNTKEEFDADYSFRCERYLPGRYVPVNDLSRNTPFREVRLNYHSYFMKTILADRWAKIVPLFSFLPTHKFVIAGSAFNWGVDALIALTGATVIGVDTSIYVDTVKGTDENADLIAAIQLEGLSELSGRGLEIYDFYKTTGARTISLVLKEDMLSNKSRNEVKKALGNSAPDWIFTEDFVQELNDTQLLAWKTEAEKLTGTTIVHLIRKEDTRTAEQLNLLTGHKVIVLGSYRVVG